MTDDERIDGLLRTWGGEQRQAAHERAGRIAMTKPRPGRRVRWVSVAAAVTVAAAVAIGAAVLTTRSSGREHLPVGQSKPATTAPPGPSVLAGSTKQVTFRHLAVRVPAAWPINDQQCGTPRADTVLVTTSALLCVTLPPRGITWVAFVSAGSGATGAKHATTRPITLDGHPGTERSWSANGNTVIQIDVPDAKADMTVTSPSPTRARAIAATLAFVDHDSFGCASESPYRPLTTGGPAAVPGAETSLVPGRPAGISVCSYGGSLLVNGRAVAGADLAKDVAALRSLPRGLSIAHPAAVDGNSCTTPKHPATSLDRFDPEWFAILVHYRSGPDLVLRVRLGLFCGYLGVTNGSVTGQRAQALVELVLNNSVGALLPTSVRPAR